MTAAQTSLGKGRVLVVDDDSAVRISTSRMLQTLRYDVVMAANGDAAPSATCRPAASCRRAA